MAAVVICCTACGLDMSKVKGNWTMETADGKTVAEIAELSGMEPAYSAMNGTVTDDTFSLTTATASISYKISVKSNGFECLDDSKNIIMSVTYDSANDALNFKMLGPDGNPVAYVMKKGTADLTVSAASTAEAGGYSAEAYYTGEAE